MKTIVHRNLGPANTPRDIRNLRQASFDFHETYGQTVIFKHRWNEDDLKKGLCQRCPLYDAALDQQHSAWDEYCFGTGYLGGYDDAKILYLAIADVAEEIIRMDPQGVLIHDKHPGVVLPWTPTMYDGDLVITAEFNYDWELLETFERYILSEVAPVTIRSPKYRMPLMVHQSARIDKLPSTDPLYNVPISFDYGAIPPVVISPSDDPGVIVIGKYTERAQPIRITGTENLTSSAERSIRVAVGGGAITAERDVRITGIGETHVLF